MPGMDGHDVKQLLAQAYPVSSVIRSIVYCSALRIAEQDDEDLVFEGERFEIEVRCGTPLDAHRLGSVLLSYDLSVPATGGRYEWEVM
eukprot:8788084-Karenia_brevis.AAC.1